MYLVELDKKTGLVKVDKEYDGVYAIKEFRDVINDKTLGIECFTAIALTADYQTPIYYYHIDDRPYKAMEEATGGNRKAFIWKQEKIQVALVKYQALQYNNLVDQERVLNFMITKQMQEITREKDKNVFKPLEEANRGNIEDLIDEYNDIKKFCNKSFDMMNAKEIKSLIRKANIYVLKPLNERKEDAYKIKNNKKILDLFSQLNTFRSLLDNFEKKYQKEELLSSGPVRNGYKLTRLEEKALNKNSFYMKPH